MNLLYKRLAFWLVSVVLISNIGISQNNLALELTDSTIFLDRLVVCGDADYQRVIFGIQGDNAAPRQEIVATLSLFDGVIFDTLDTSSSTAGVSLDVSSTPERPVFRLPNLGANGLTTIEIGFTIKANCDLVTVINNNNEIQVFDTWQLAYALEGTPLIENFDGTEYRNTIAIPNLSLEVQSPTTAILLNTPFQQEIKVINSGLNSYLNQFTYSFTSEQGVVVQALKVGDDSLPIEKTINSSGDTVVMAMIGADVFTTNRSQSGLLGNGDGRFDVDEVVLLTADLIVNSCEANGSSELRTTHSVEWGCASSSCQQENITSSLSLGIGEEQVGFEVGTNAINPSFCGIGTTSILISNNGFEFDEGLGTIFDINVGIGFSSGQRFSLAEGGYEITSVQIGDALQLGTDSLINLGLSDFFSEDPDGAGGLTDADGDGFYDDLPVGEQFSIIASYQLDCTVGINFDLLNNCDNDFRAGFDGRIIYRNSCGEINQRNFDDFFSSSNAGGTQEICSDPDVFNNNDEFTFVYSGERRRSNFIGCDGDDEIRTRLILPEGVQVTEKTFLEQDSVIFTPTITRESEEWIVTFNAAGFSHNKDYDLNLVFRTECAITGFTSYPIQIEYLCSECDCEQLWYCGILEGTWVHASGPPCEEAICEVGLAVNSFNVERTTFGYTDETFTTPIDPTTANKEVALTCDSVRMTVNTTVGQTALSDSIGLIITYGNADESASFEETFLFSDGLVTITRTDGTESSCVIPKERVRVDTSNSTKQINIDLNACLEGNTLNEGDQVTFVGNYAINTDAPAPLNIFKKIPEFRVRAYAFIDGVVYDDCENYGSLFRIAKLATRFSGPSNTTFPTGCEGVSMVYSLNKSINATAMRTFFGEEHRQAVHIDSVSLVYDPALVTAFSNVVLDYRVQQGDWIPLSDFTETNLGSYEVNLPGIVTSITGSNQLVQVRLSLVPECSSSFSSANTNGVYDFSAIISYTDLYYASEIGDGSCSEQKLIEEERSISYENPPTFSFQGIDSDIVTTTGEIEWIVEYCNTSFNADAGLTWIAFDLPNDSIELISLELLSQTGTSEVLPLQAYGSTNTQFFSIAPGVLRNVGGNSNDDICNIYRIRARSMSCERQTVLASAGWNCTDFEEPDWTPDRYTPCIEQTIGLSAITSFPFLSADYLAESSVINGSLCDTSIIDLIVRNEEDGAAFDVSTQITVPIGTRLVPNSFEFAYPSSSPFVAVTTDPQLIETDPIDGNTYEFTDFAPLHNFLDNSGLPGFNVNMPDSSEFRLKYRLVTDCDFNNGSVNRYRFQGLTSCGEPSNVALADTPPFIFEANPNTSRAFAIELIEEPIISNSSSTLALRVINTGNNASIIDSIHIIFPSNIDYIPNSSEPSSGLEWDIQNPFISQTDSSLELRYPLPVGLNSGEAVSLRLQVMGNDIICGDGIPISITTTSVEDFFCVVTGANCSYSYLSTATADTEFVLDCTEFLCEPPAVLLQDTLLIPLGQDAVSYCLQNVSIRNLNETVITNNGQALEVATPMACNIQETCIISYSNLRNVQERLVVESWSANGNTFSGEVATIAELLDSINTWDPRGNWELNETSLVFQGGHSEGDYSSMNIYVPSLDTRFVLGYDARTVANGTAISLGVGQYNIVVQRGEGCADSISLVVIGQETDTCIPPAIANTITENSICGENLGSATISVSGNIEDFIIEWTPNIGNIGATDNIRTDLAAGGYIAKISRTSDTTCFIEQPIVITNSDGPTATVNSTLASCGEQDGTATFAPANYTYTWSDGGTGAARTDLGKGNYFITFTNPTDPTCSNVATVAIEEQNDLTATFVVEEYPNCTETNGVVQINVAGGSGDYGFDFPSGTNRQDGLAPGIYRVNITDLESGCQLQYPFLLESRASLDTLTLTTVTDINCAGGEDGEVAFTIQYSNNFLLPADTIISNGSTTFKNGALPEGDYFVYIQDVTGCITASAPFTIDAPAIRSINVLKPNNCDTTQFINIEVVGDNANLSFDWADLPGSDNGATRTDLASGDYELTISDDRNCTTSLSVTLPDCCIPPEMRTNITPMTCGENGEIEIIIDGNISDFVFSITPAVGDNSSNINIYENVPAGTYRVTVGRRDNPECFQTVEVTVIEEGSNNLGLLANTDPVTCFTNGRMELSVNGDLADYTFSTIPEIINLSEPGNVFENIAAGEYRVTATLNGVENCSQTIDVTVASNLLSELVTDTILTAPTCANQAGRVALQMVEAPQRFNYTFLPDLGIAGDTPNIRDSLPPGVYSVTVTANDNEACTQIINFRIDTLSTAELVTDIITVEATCGATNGMATLQVEGAITDFEFSWEEGAGEIGESPNIRTGLAIGNYIITVTDTTTGCMEEVQLSIAGDENSMIAVEDAITNPSCGETNGEVTFTLAGDPSTYIFEWTPDIGIFGETENIRTNLPSGEYEVEIRDRRDTTCKVSVPIRLENMEPSAAGIITSPTCNTTTDGRVTFSPDIYEYTWEDGFVGGQRDSLLAGTYTITITDTRATDTCQSTMDIRLVAINSLEVSVNIDQQPSCTNDDGMATILTAGSGDYTFSWSSNRATNTNLAAGTQVVTITDNETGCEATIEVVLENPNEEGACENCPITVGRDTTRLSAVDCDTLSAFCLAYDLSAQSPYMIALNGEAINKEDLATCDLDSIVIYSFSNLVGQGALGPYDLTSWQVNEEEFIGNFNNIIELTALMNEFDPQAAWRISQNGLFIIGNNSENIYQPMLITANNGVFTTALGVSKGVLEGRIINLPAGEHEIIISSTQSFCTDTLIVFASCNTSTDSINIEIEIGEMDTLCFPTTELIGDSVTVSIDCLEGEVVSTTVLGDTCVIITGENVGQDTACIILCDELGNCDTNIVTIQVIFAIYRDSIFVGQTEEICIGDDALGIDGRFTTIEEIREEESTSISYEIDETTGCIRYMGSSVGIDSTSFVFCTEEGICDTIPFIIQADNKPGTSINDTLFINEEAEYCFDTTVLPGEIVSFENICPEEMGDAVEFVFNTNTFCIEYKGLELGRDSVCFVLCDDLDNCDTVYLGVTVIEYEELPLAVDDIDTAIINDPKVINILKNDIPFGVFVEDIRIIDPPLYGDAIPTLDGSVTYTSEEYCARSDEFTYEICNNVGCDSATVKIWIECIDIVVFTAVSPNRDMVNDYFFISGIEDFPNNRLQVFNRWGERVFDTVGYQNDWDGTWKGNMELPDGTYFYVLELNDDEERVFQGYLEIHR